MPVFDQKRNVTSLQTLPISKASAKQRAGRAGRTRPGMCFRLYSEANFESADESMQPSIMSQSLNLTSLRLINMGIDPVRFPWMTAPSSADIMAAIESLVYLGALREKTAPPASAASAAGAASRLALAFDTPSRLVAASSSSLQFMNLLHQGPAAFPARLEQFSSGFELTSLGNDIIGMGSTKLEPDFMRMIRRACERGFGEVAVALQAAIPNGHRLYAFGKTDEEKRLSRTAKESRRSADGDAVDTTMIFLEYLEQATSKTLLQVPGAAGAAAAATPPRAQVGGRSAASGSPAPLGLPPQDQPLKRRADESALRSWCSERFLSARGLKDVHDSFIASIKALQSLPWWSERRQDTPATPADLRRIFTAGFFLTASCLTTLDAQRYARSRTRLLYQSLRTDAYGTALRSEEAQPAKWIVFYNMREGKNQEVYLNGLCPIDLAWLEEENKDWAEKCKQRAETVFVKENAWTGLSHLVIRGIFGRSQHKRGDLERLHEVQFDVSESSGTISVIGKSPRFEKAVAFVQASLAAIQDEALNDFEIQSFRNARLLVGLNGTVRGVLLKNETVRINCTGLSNLYATPDLLQAKLEKVVRRACPPTLWAQGRIIQKIEATSINRDVDAAASSAPGSPASPMAVARGASSSAAAAAAAAFNCSPQTPERKLDQETASGALLRNEGSAVVTFTRREYAKAVLDNLRSEPGIRVQAMSLGSDAGAFASAVMPASTRFEVSISWPQAPSKGTATLAFSSAETANAFIRRVGSELRAALPGVTVAGQYSALFPMGSANWQPGQLDARSGRYAELPTTKELFGHAGRFLLLFDEEKIAKSWPSNQPRPTRFQVRITNIEKSLDEQGLREAILRQDSRLILTDVRLDRETPAATSWNDFQQVCLPLQSALPAADALLQFAERGRLGARAEFMSAEAAIRAYRSACAIQAASALPATRPDGSPIRMECREVFSVTLHQELYKTLDGSISSLMRAVNTCSSFRTFITSSADVESVGKPSSAHHRREIGFSGPAGAPELPQFKAQLLRLLQPAVYNNPQVGAMLAYVAKPVFEAAVRSASKLAKAYVYWSDRTKSISVFGTPHAQHIVRAELDKLASELQSLPRERTLVLAKPRQQKPWEFVQEVTSAVKALGVRVCRMDGGRQLVFRAMDPDAAGVENMLNIKSWLRRNVRPVRAADAGGEEPRSCCVCPDDIEDGDEFKMVCGHDVHKVCMCDHITKTDDARQATCPVCKSSQIPSALPPGTSSRLALSRAR